MKKIQGSRIQRKIWFRPKVRCDQIAFSFLRQCKNIIDIRCGSGRFITQAKDRFVGLDWSDASLYKCKSQWHNLIKGDARQLLFEGNSVEGIHCSHLIEHFEPSDVHRILFECGRVLVSKGILVIKVLLLWYGFYFNLTCVKPYNSEEILHYLTPSKVHTFSQIKDLYKVLCLKKRFGHIDSRNIIVNLLARFRFPWLKKRGLMLVLQKSG